ncbi:RNA-binding protein, putative [Plasmodium ovale wallikeri]|uniref:RNA-binding protein, putative n=1 Tax=Plasmodium ovale wallikeri TaxID=864142 RepID=A0A1A8Z2A4_PLAOA|nr:RNA-binding protein, putative [Plasmodium ovale wallikeri]
MNVHLNGLSLQEEGKNKIRKKNKRTIHIKNTYISPYVLYNKRGNNNKQLENLNRIFTNENRCVFIKENYNYIKDGSHEKKILRYALFNELNLKYLKNREEECELNTITTTIQMNSEYGSDKDNETIINEKTNLVDCIKKVTIISSKDFMNNEKTKHFLHTDIPFRKSNNLRIGSNSYIRKKSYKEQNTPTTLCSVTPTMSCTDHANMCNVRNTDMKKYKETFTAFSTGNDYTCEESRNKSRHESDSSMNDVIYKCEDSIPLGTILNIHNLDSNNNNILTTVMLRNIPNKYTQNMLMDVMNEHFRGLYDFFYLPIDFRNKCNVGYAFINFIHPHYAELFIKFFNNYKLSAFKSNKVCTVTWGRVQGLKANIEHYRNSAIMTIPIPQYKPILFQNGITVSWPESDGPLPAIKLRSQRY